MILREDHSNSRRKINVGESDSVVFLSFFRNCFKRLFFCSNPWKESQRELALFLRTPTGLKKSRKVDLLRERIQRRADMQQLESLSLSCYWTMKGEISLSSLNSRLAFCSFVVFLCLVKQRKLKIMASVCQSKLVWTEPNHIHALNGRKICSLRSVWFLRISLSVQIERDSSK